MKKLAKFFAVFCAVAITLGGCGASSQSKTEDKGPGTARDGNEFKIEKASINLHNQIEKGKYKIISTEELKKMIDNKDSMVLVDTMPAKHFDKKRIPGAVNAELPVKMKDVTPEEKEAFLKVLGTDKNKPIVVYCGFVGCARSDVGARLALEAGYKNVYRVPGGIMAWLDAGYPIEGSDAK